MIRVVAAALVEDGRVLVARRAPHQRNAGLWEFPGGKVEAGESDAQALARELEEELDIEIAVDRWLAEAVHAYDWGSICLVALRCRLVDGQPTPLEHAELRWVEPEELHTIGLSPADLPLIDAIVAELTPAAGPPAAS